MICTITLNPAIDLVIIAKKLESNTVSRTENFKSQPGGKGISVSFILKKMGVKNMTTGIGGGFTLDYTTAGLRRKGIKTKFLKVREPIRINVFTRVLDQSVEYKEVNPGPKVGREVQGKFLKYLKNTLKADDILTISSSFSRGIKAEHLVEIAKITAGKDVKLVIDSSSKVALDMLQCQPYSLKPNDQELASFFDLNEKLDRRKIIELTHKLISADCQNVLVSLGENGVTLINKGHVYLGNAPEVQALNTADAGDTVLGTFIGEKGKDKSDTAALKSAITASSDIASRSGLTDLKLEEYSNKVQVSEVK